VTDKKLSDLPPDYCPQKPPPPPVVPPYSPKAKELAKQVQSK